MDDEKTAPATLGSKKTPGKAASADASQGGETARALSSYPIGTDTPIEKRVQKPSPDNPEADAWIKDRREAANAKSDGPKENTAPRPTGARVKK